MPAMPDRPDRPDRTARRPRDLRTRLLDGAEAALRERGLGGLSLREVAREAGVSHGAPRNHFVDRDALLDALVVRGFRNLTAAIGSAAGSAPAAYPERLRAAALAAVAFATDNAAMLDLMFATKASDPSDQVRQAAEALFDVVGDVIGGSPPAERFRGGDVFRLTMLWSATVQGISSLVTSRRATPEQAATIVDDAVAVFVAGTREGI